VGQRRISQELLWLQDNSLIDFPILCHHKALQYLRNFATSIWLTNSSPRINSSLILRHGVVHGGGCGHEKTPFFKKLNWVLPKDALVAIIAVAGA
jgi:hypothetical protein